MECTYEKAINHICNNSFSKTDIYAGRIYFHTTFRDNKKSKSFGMRYEPILKKWYILSNNPNVRIVDTLFTRIDL